MGDQELEDVYFRRMGEYQGERNQFAERHGQGKALYDNGDQYVGEFKDGKRDGEGTYSFKSAIARYKGSFTKGKRDGFGTMIYGDGGRYEGNWKNGIKDGNGTYYFKNGDVLQGSWKDDKKHGKCLYTYGSTGSKFSAKWVDGKQQGYGEWIHSNHQYRGKFKDSRPVGRGKYIFDNHCEQHGYYAERDILKQVGQRMELIGSEPAWHSEMITSPMPYNNPEID